MHARMHARTHVHTCMHLYACDAHVALLSVFTLQLENEALAQLQLFGAVSGEGTPDPLHEEGSQLPATRVCVCMHAHLCVHVLGAIRKQ